MVQLKEKDEKFKFLSVELFQFLMVQLKVV